MPTTPIIRPEDAAALLFQAIVLIAAGFAGAPITAFIVSVLKRLPPLQETPMGTLNTVVGLLLTVIFWVAVRLGYQGQFETVVTAVLTIGPALVQLVTTWTGANATYKLANKAEVVIVGHARAVDRVSGKP